jgi:hypothetical protein
MEKEVSPIFVIGPHRSGTTWLANEISRHEYVYAVKYKNEVGVHESAFFSSVAPYFNWGVSSVDRKALMMSFEGSSFFKRCYSNLAEYPKIEGKTIFEYFEDVMAFPASESNCRYWLEKTPDHTYVIKKIKNEYPSAKVVSIQRELKSAVESAVHKWGRKNSILSWLKYSIRTSVMKKMINKNEDIDLRIKYKDLKNEKKVTLKRIFDFLGLDIQKKCEVKYDKNSTFEKDRPEIKTWQVAAVRFAQVITHLTPYSLIYITVSTYIMSTSSLPVWFYGAKKTG